MEKIDVTKLKKNEKLIRSYISKKDGKWYTKEQLHILFPKKYIDKGLTILDNVSLVFGVIMIMDNKYNYGKMLLPNRLEVIPNEIDEVEVEGERWVKLTIEKGEPFLVKDKVVKNTDFVFNAYDLFLMQGKVPFFVTYEDILTIFTNLPKYTGGKVGKDPLIFEILIAIITRHFKELTKEYREVIKTEKDVNKIPFKVVGLKNPYLSFRSTYGKLLGSYFEDAMLGALLFPEDEVTDSEYALRK